MEHLSLISITPEIEQYVDAMSTYLKGVLMSDKQEPAEDNADREPRQSTYR